MTKSEAKETGHRAAYSATLLPYDSADDGPEVDIIKALLPFYPLMRRSRWLLKQKSASQHAYARLRGRYRQYHPTATLASNTLTQYTAVVISYELCWGQRHEESKTFDTAEERDAWIANFNKDLDKQPIAPDYYERAEIGRTIIPRAS